MCSPANSRSLLKTSPYHSRLFSYVGAHRCVRPTIAWLSSGQTHRSAPTAKLQTSCVKHFAFARRENEGSVEISCGQFDSLISCVTSRYPLYNEITFAVHNASKSNSKKATGTVRETAESPAEGRPLCESSCK